MRSDIATGTCGNGGLKKGQKKGQKKGHRGLPQQGPRQQSFNNNYRFFYIPDILLQYSLAILEVADEKILSRQRSDDIIKEAAPWQKENVPEGMTGGR